MHFLSFLLVGLLLCAGCNSKKSSGKQNKPSGLTEVNVSAFQVNPDSVLFSFVFMGCNRVDGKDTGDSNTNASTANIPELQRTFNEIAALNPKPVFYFFLGDEVLGLDTKLNHLQDELKAWRKQYEDTGFSALPASGITLVAVPGNHEMLYSHHHDEFPNAGATDIWMKEMGRYMPAGVSINRVPGPDSLNNLATYSFTYGNTHFIVMNTDTYNTTGTIGLAPAQWIVDDMTRARADKTVQHIFLLGHKPAVVSQPLYAYDGESTMDTSVVRIIWPQMIANGAEAMLSAHSHQYDRLQPVSGGPYQIIAGNGGSPYEHKASKDPDRQFFGYTIIYVMKNGQVLAQSMGRSVPASGYLESIPASLPTTMRDSVNISRGTNAGTWVPWTGTMK